MIKFGQKLKSSEMKGKLLLTSDLHFMHNNVLKFCKETRPWENVDDMTEGLIEHWNSVVDPDDEVLYLGDMFFCSKEYDDVMMKLEDSNLPDNVDLSPMYKVVERYYFT